VRATAREVGEDFRAEAESKGLKLVWEEAESEPVTIHSDHARVRQILSNLVSNAVKYTQQGGTIRIVVERRQKPDDGDSPWIAIDVTDDGPGISPEQQALLFQEFSRFDATAIQGSGIGLAISDRISRALGGAITVKSGIGRGSTFTLWLPAGVTKVQPGGAASRVPFSSSEPSRDPS
jgi:signal transduction histidine kinase